MRPYRGWTKDGKEVHGWYFKDGDCAYILETRLMIGGSLIVNRIVDGMVKVIPETVGQFTGQHDRNKQEAYFGDLVKFKKIIGIYEIRWDTIRGRIFLHSKNDKGTSRFLPAELIKAGEIIGNIQENPDLTE